jgi:hypothetical protein
MVSASPPPLGSPSRPYGGRCAWLVVFPDAVFLRFHVELRKIGSPGSRISHDLDAAHILAPPDNRSGGHECTLRKRG